ncbi:MAG: SUMF1/EgtB/PvdO family nonheme iron enzyme [Bacteroidales bacterium]|nr:SUMF1/EgtB/PvdO family nonheme iron enzyme [Bacteroidales bacterium]
MKAKITFIMTLVCLLTGIDMKAQNNLSNIDVQQQDTVIYVSYDLQHKSDIYLYVSLNNGKTFLGPMNYVSGDVGYNVHSGEKKVVFWYAVSEMGYFSNSNVKFKIVAKSSKDGYLNKADLQYVKVDGEKPFEIGMTEVTVYQYAQFVENTGYNTTAELSGYSYVWNGSSWEKKPGVNWNTDNNGKIISITDSQSKPVTNLSYKDVVAFCEWAGCRLPSVEEWTIAAKGGESTIYSGSNKAHDVAWNYNNAGGKTRNVASKKANAFGIYDMCGNVAEWTSDKTGNEYVFCGGSCYSGTDNCTVDSKSHSVATGSNSLVGFRVVKASSKDMALPVIMIEENRNDEPSFTEQKSFISQSGENTFTVNGVTFEMIAVEGGTFTMGATSEQEDDAFDDEKPTHSVTLGDYYIGKFEVTQELWEAVMGSNPSYFKGSKLPVESVSWDDCQEFITKLNNLTGANFRLPTEAEWEYAARGGNKNGGCKYSGSNNINAVAWYWGFSSYETHTVGTKSPNELGIYDMSGNVLEWCQDRYGNYGSDSQTDQQGPSLGSYRVLRGGSWRTLDRYCRVSSRDSNTPDSRGYYYGFRLVLVL